MDEKKPALTTSSYAVYQRFITKKAMRSFFLATGQWNDHVRNITGAAAWEAWDACKLVGK